MDKAEMVQKMTELISAVDEIAPHPAVMADCLDSAEALYYSLRFPFASDDDLPDSVERKYINWVYRAALEIYSKSGADGQTAHSENGISRTWDSSGISEALKREIVPKCGVVS